MADGKPGLEWVIVCDDVRAEMGDKISLMGLFDSIWVQGFPAVHPRLAIVSAWSGIYVEHKSEIEIVSQNGELVQAPAIAPLKPVGQGQLARYIAISFNVQFKSEGIYQIKISLDNTFYRSIPLPVRIAGKPQ